MKHTLRIVALVTILNANSAFAASGVEGGGFSLIGWIFIGFMTLVITLQSVPAVMMFGSMMAAVFGKAMGTEKKLPQTMQ